MKKIILAVGTTMTLVFSGCSTKQILLDEGQAVAIANNYEPFVTYACIDILDKKECLLEHSQIDLPNVPIYPFSTRLCFGFSEIMQTPEGMICYHYDIIKGN